MYYQTQNPHGGDIYAEKVELDYSANTNPLGVPPAVIAAAAASLERADRYPDPYCRALVKAISEAEGVKPEYILCGNGASELIFAFCAAARVKKAAALAPTFSEYASALELFGGETALYPLRQEAGFLPAPAYVNGDVKDEIGGGACQVSSTLYAATAFAFLETVDRSCHVFPVNYMQMGTDATVTIPKEGKSIDFKFRNNKNFPIKIVTDFNDEERTISVEIWGTLEDDDYMPVEFDNTYGWTYDYDRFIDPAYPDREGYTIKFLVDIYNGTEEDGRFFYRTITHRQVIDQEGNIVEDTILNPGEPGKYAMDTYYEHP